MVNETDMTRTERYETTGGIKAATLAASAKLPQSTAITNGIVFF